MIYHRLNLIVVVCLVAALLTFGCSSIATKQKFYDPIEAELRAGNAVQAAALMETAREDNKFAEKDRFLYFTDAGMLGHYNGDWANSNNKLHLAEKASEELFTKLDEFIVKE